MCCLTEKKSYEKQNFKWNKINTKYIKNVVEWIKIKLKLNITQIHKEEIIKKSFFLRKPEE